MALNKRFFETEAEAVAFEEGLHYHNDDRIGVEEIKEVPGNLPEERWLVVIYDATYDEEEDDE